MPENIDAGSRGSDWVIVGSFFLACLCFLILGTGFGLFALLIALGLALRQERIYRSYPEQPSVKYAGFWLRLGSNLADGAVGMIFLFIGYLIFKKSIFEYFNHSFFWLSYFALVLFMQKRWGQSPGKMAMGIKIVKTDLGEIGWKEVFLRNIMDAF